MADAPTRIPASEQHSARDEQQLVLPSIDVRRKRPPALSFLLRLETLRRVSRVTSLLALDFVCLLAALVVALMVKAVLRDHVWAWHASLESARHTLAFAYLVTALLFARSGLYAERAQRPGLSRIVSSLFETMVVALIFAVVNGEEFSSYYIFYGTFASPCCSSGSPAGATSSSRACCCAPPATGAGPCWWARAATSRTWRTR